MTTNYYPQAQQPPSWVFNVGAFFEAVSEHIAQVRTVRNLPALVSSDGARVGQVQVGEEYLAAFKDAPGIVVVPVGAYYEPARHLQSNGGGIGIQAGNPKILWSQWLRWDAHVWGYPDNLSDVMDVNSFSFTLELAREFLDALRHVNGGIPRIKPEVARWVQNTNLNRVGRKYVLTFALETYVTDEPYIILSPVTADVSVSMLSADGSSTTSETDSFTVP